MFTVRENFNTTPLSGFKIGGRVRYFVELADEQDLPELFNRIQQSRLPYFIMGESSNLFLGAENYDGWAIKIALKGINQEGEIFQAKAGNLLAELVEKTVQAGYRGLQKLKGIPGTVGGAIRGNAGSFGTEISATLTEVKIFDPAKMEFKILKKPACAFRYRESIFVLQKDLVIVSAKFSLLKEEKTKLVAELEKIVAQRKAKPYSYYPSGGSIFKNIRPDQIEDKKAREFLVKKYQEKTGSQKVDFIPAGFLLEEAGLKGKRNGRAGFSKRHGNVIINFGGAKAAEVLALISLAKKKVRTKWGLELEEEIVCAGL